MVQVKDLIGVPFVSRGRDPRTGLDCWGLVMEVGRRFGKQIPDFYVDAHDSAQIGVIKSFVEREWLKVERPEPGAVVGIALDRLNMPDITQHYGICLDRRRFVQCLEGSGVVVTDFSHRFFKNIITGYYQWIA